MSDRKVKIAFLLSALAMALSIGCSSLPKLPSGYCWGTGSNGLPAPIPCVTPATPPTAPPTPDPVVTPTPTVTPTPQTSAQSFPQGLPDSAYVGQTGETGEPTAGLFRSAMATILQRRGVHCEGDGCDKVPATCQQFGLEIGAELRSRGVSASLYNESWINCDQVYVCRPPESDPWLCVWDAWEYGSDAWDGKIGCGVRWPFAGGASYAGTYRITNVSTSICAPTPRVDWWELSIHNTAGPSVVLAATPGVHGLEYCTAIGMGDNGTRHDCPVRNEGDPLREKCEAQAVGGVPLWVWDGNADGGPGKLEDGGNPYLWYTSHGSAGAVKVCTADGRVCSRTITLTGGE